ncbi:hypothetical protein acsn021_44130 [Anaerocolumna cellulosilytica]|uniref:Uncharacterized protein n=1 Tax=Anaerocolumna cellulosilytica TaxID=433286 RepID=A0A6S6R1Q7_9FIRM|nr:sporulation integral membrane protein YtvI [Anaerocolumna cellulosilytica]MBB5195834.1 sporulation integral membrane protein YtvI [Anaerocolumna cellulosilytica]BCJ96844.1 hypothetical protein acsn021_44130 [Anaerocolumna cellulosilytica]
MVINNKKIKLLLILILSIVGVYIGFEYILPLFIPFILAYLIAAAILPVVRFLYRRIRMPKIFGGIISLGILGTGFGWILCYLVDLLLKQLTVLLRNLPIYLSVLGSFMDRFSEGCDKFFGIQLGTVQSFIYSNFDGLLVIVKNKIIPVITTRSINLLIGIVGFAGIILIVLVSVLLLVKDEDQYSESFKNSFFYQEIHIVTGKLSEMGIAYLKTQAIMLGLIGAVCTVGLLLIHNKYALLIGIAIGIFDAFPILGSGLILVPWGIIEIINKDLYSGAILLTVYLCCQLIRQFLEPKLLGSRIGIKPVYTLMSMYAGVNLFGFAGFILGPIGLVIVTTIVKECKERLVITKEM